MLTLRSPGRPTFTFPGTPTRVSNNTMTAALKRDKIDRISRNDQTKAKNRQNKLPIKASTIKRVRGV